MKKITAVFLITIIFLEMIIISGCSPGKGKELRIFDSNGEEIALLQSISDGYKELDGNDRRAYIEAVLSESEEIIAEERSCSVEEARDYLLKKECAVHTAFDDRVYESVKNAYESQGISELDFGCAVTDLHGGLLALFSAGSDNGIYVNYATEKTPPYSSFKPLCVYTPAIENGLAVWSSVYLDSPIKTVERENGQITDWPANATGIYTNENKSLFYAIKTSLNTVAVRCMQTVGVNNSFDFLDSKFGLSLDFEKKKAALYGDDEVIGNVTLGYLYEGVSPADMAGYYQIFANGGSYCKPHTVLKICDKNEETVYEYKLEEKQVIKSSTAYIMNRLLQNVVTAGGTGENARCEGVSVGGKTGTGDLGNWFVGFTPQYTCAVWHGTELEKNNSCEIFSEAVSCFEYTSDKDYPDCAEIKKAAFCSESGMLFSEKCRKADMGYYASDSIPEACNIHN